MNLLQRKNLNSRITTEIKLSLKRTVEMKAKILCNKSSFTARNSEGIVSLKTIKTRVPMIANKQIRKVPKNPKNKNMIQNVFAKSSMYLQKMNEEMKQSTEKYRRRFRVNLSSPQRRLQYDSEFYEAIKLPIQKSSSKMILDELK